VDWSPGRGSEQLGRRPALVIQTDSANSNPRYPNTIVATISTKGLPVPSHIEILPSPTNGLREVSYVKCEQLFTISKERLERLYGVVSGVDMLRVETGLRKMIVL
jgi:mRNA interferase MazF